MKFLKTMDQTEIRKEKMSVKMGVLSLFGNLNNPYMISQWYFFTLELTKMIRF